MDYKMTKNLIHLNQDNFDKEIVKSTTPVIVDFWAQWCAPCRMMGPVFEELSSGYVGKLKFAKLNTEEEPVLASKFNIMGIPSLLILKGGKEVDRIVGFVPKQVLKQKIDSTLATI
ncbi:MAG: thioredoxin [Nanoarchaeota archaeon]|nr:thioredoxin [Nanoarchaeota archaeon]MBU1269731.1 thioredoxin [Nanoarchaeota archaeon]MBU1604566.1 thioredoxin [Nanoarchaeota archaeon]MBU2442826.1 thioredoxin [Nanoarchaeota archaeon]